MGVVCPPCKVRYSRRWLPALRIRRWSIFLRLGSMVYSGSDAGLGPMPPGEYQTERAAAPSRRRWVRKAEQDVQKCSDWDSPEPLDPVGCAAPSPYPVPVGLRACGRAAWRHGAVATWQLCTTYSRNTALQPLYFLYASAMPVASSFLCLSFLIACLSLACLVFIGPFPPFQRRTEQR